MHAYQEVQSVDSLWWEETTKDLSYESEKKPEIKKTSGTSPGFLGQIGPILSYIVLAILVIILVFILVKILSRDMSLSRSARVKKSYDFFDAESMEHGFMEMDLEKGLENARSEGDWKLAMRIRYLMTLKNMVRNKALLWRKDYSNAELKNQLEGEMKISFATIILEIERAYFSKMLVLESYFSTFDNGCDHFEKTYLNYGR